MASIKKTINFLQQQNVQHAPKFDYNSSKLSKTVLFTVQTWEIKQEKREKKERETAKGDIVLPII